MAGSENGDGQRLDSSDSDSESAPEGVSITDDDDIIGGDSCIPSPQDVKSVFVCDICGFSTPFIYNYRDHRNNRRKLCRPKGVLGDEYLAKYDRHESIETLRRIKATLLKDVPADDKAMLIRKLLARLENYNKGADPHLSSGDLDDIKRDVQSQIAKIYLK